MFNATKIDKKNQLTNSEIKRTWYPVGLTKAVAAEIGISQQAVRDVLKGKTRGKYQNLIKRYSKIYLTKIRKEKNMKVKEIKGFKKPPRHGFIGELAKLCGCSRHTVRTAIYDNAKGVKADFVRKMYRTNYKSINI